VSTPLVSVVMSVFNGERFLREAMDSILDQSFRDFEFIVIDDGSTDGSGAVLRSYQGSDDRLRVYPQENRGLTDSLNLGCSLARGRYILRMDADDVAIRDRLLWQLDFMERNPDVAVLGGAVELIDPLGSPLGFGYSPVNDDEIRSKFPECPFWHPTILMRTEAFLSTRGYRKVVVDSEDHDLWLRMGDKFKLANLARVVLRYRVHPDQVSVRKCKQQTLSALAAQVAFLARGKGEPDPLDEVNEITPALLVELGVSATQQDTIVAQRYLWRAVRYSCSNDECIVKTLKEIDDMLLDVKHTAKSWALADLQLLKAKLYWRQSRRLKTIGMCAHALWTRPMIITRPLKPMLRLLGVIPFRKAGQPSWLSGN
jgi:glycosyltransferase involved in cell wall biosynthesis